MFLISPLKLRQPYTILPTLVLRGMELCHTAFQGSRAFDVSGLAVKTQLIFQSFHYWFYGLGRHATLCVHFKGAVLVMFVVLLFKLR